MPIVSQTTDIKNYGRYDDGVYDDGLFPESIPSSTEMLVGSTVKYFYELKFYAFDAAYDIYAEWSLTDEALKSEISRIEALFEELKGNRTNYDFAEVERGNFTCFVMHKKGTSPFEIPSGELPASGYHYTVFAYDEDNGRVRYIVTDCIDMVDDTVPYHLKLDW